jgi:predicted metalloprotease
MKWEGGEQSDNVEDRRGMKGGVAAGGGIGALVLAAVIYFVTGDARLAQQAGQIAKQQGAPQQKAAPINDRTKAFVGTVLKFTEVVWDDQFKQFGERYEKPKLVLFSEAVATGGCGNAPSAVGPFYCPADRTVYLDPTFFEELEQKLGGSKAEFSQAYVIAHEVGHHVQNLLGYNGLVNKYERREGKNAGVRLELQADYLAGVWAHHGQQKFRFIEPGDVESALTTARAIGDDRIQKKTQGWTSPESYTHGTAEQRLKYFRQGLETGDASKPKLDRFFDPKVNPLEL